ncbi:MAG: SDR family oxidoreductase [Propionibacteriaceae bacterium]|jgi:3-oxoacyl-[acyl-carrier protein] reductase|nr:SDR family oxidoreductase [Propionibacteriaceae bacterium]
MLIDLTGKVAIVTGAARGIGRTIADRLLAEGVAVEAWDARWPDAAETGPSALRTGASAASSPHARSSDDGGELIPSVVDVTDGAAVARAVEAARERHGRVDILVNNAGITIEAPVEEMAEADWARVIDVNLTGVFTVCRAVAPLMREQAAGRIINASSFAAIIPSIGGAAYAASKAGVVSLTRVLASELGPWGVTVNAYAPGMVPSDINHFTERPAVEQAALLDTLSLRRWEEADDVADLVCFLASDQAKYITGSLIDVSGGKFATQRPHLAHRAATTAGPSGADRTASDGAPPLADAALSARLSATDPSTPA